MSRFFVLGSWIALFLGIAPAARGDAIVVDPAPFFGNGVLALTAALASATDGDVLLLRAGNYTINPNSLVTLDKRVSLVNDSGAPLSMCAVRIVNNPTDKSVALRGLTITSQVNTLSPVSIVNSFAPVWIEDCILQGPPGSIAGLGFAHGKPAVSMNTGVLHIVRSTLTGGSGVYDAASHSTTYGGSALESQGYVAVSHSTLIGGSPSSVAGNLLGASDFPGSGVTALSGEVFLADCVVKGGSAFPSGLNAGYALKGNPSTKWFVRHSTLQSGGNNPPVHPGSSVVTTLSAPVRSFEITSPVRTGQLATIDVSGQPGDLCAIFVGAPYRPLISKDLQGALVLDPSTMIGPLVLGNVDGSGSLSVSFPTAPLPAGSTGVALPIQGLILSPLATLESGSLYVQIAAGM